MDVYYSLRHYAWGSLDPDLEKAVGIHCDGAGTGMGERDMGWTFPTKAKAEAAKNRIRAKLRKRLRITIRESIW